jgi:uncharacterized protein (DUF2147 family)
MTRFAFIVVVLAGLAGPAFAEDITGVWLNSSGDAHIRIAKCGGEHLCGTIIWLKQPTDPATGRPVTDNKNPDAAKRSRPLLGIEVAIGFAPSRDEPGKYVGSFYNAEDGGTYRGSMMPQNADNLRVEGCLLVFCQTQTWTRVSH